MSTSSLTPERSRRVYLVGAGLLLLVTLGVVGYGLERESRTSTSSALVVRRAPGLSTQAELRSTSGDVPELWIVRPDRSAVKVSRLADGEGVRENFTWSPDGSLLAFETYDLEGHSPLTMFHVWVVNRDGSGLAEVILPSPNERFSTHFNEWIDDNTVRVSSNLLSEDNVLFDFAYSTREVRRSSGV